jgi:hypothetical protein
MLTYFPRMVEAESSIVPAEDVSLQLPPAHEAENVSLQLPPAHENDSLPVPDGKRRKHNKRTSAHAKFAKNIESSTGLHLLAADDRGGRAVSQCGHCLAVNHQTFFYNVTKKWVTHSKKCPGLHKKLLPAHPAEVQAFVTHVRLGGDQHRKNLCDAYVNTYWIYKHKLAFTTGDKLREVCTLYFVGALLQIPNS